MFGLTIAFTVNESHLEFKMACNRPRTRMCRVHTGHNVALAVHELTEV